MVHYLR